MAVANALVAVLKGNALKKFMWCDDEYKGKGSKMLAVLKDDFAASSKTQVAKKMLVFFQDSPQGDSSSDSYEADLQ